MPYTKTVWVNDTTPAMSAVNLNKLTNELKAQTLLLSISHTLPTWVDGATPAVSDAAPWNEMERVAKAVATGKSLSYTETVWQAGWSPARNAANLNKLETQAQANRTAIDGAPSGYYLYEEWASGTIPSPWTATTFFNYQGANGSVAVVTDPLAQRGSVLRLRCPYTPSTMALDASYPSSLLQSGAVAIFPQYAHGDQGDETWYRADFMFPTGNVFCNGYSNFLVEWHTQATGPTSSGMFAYGNYPLTTGGTTAPKLVFVVRSGDINAPTQRFFPGNTTAVETASGITIQTNHWYKSVWHFRWRADGTGLSEWFLDDVQIFSVAGANHFTDPNEIFTYACYNYRYHVSGDSNIYYDTMALGPTRVSIGG